ncbi:RadC family protein [Burkholderia ubonensis]|uniref:RadC family protein n=1 Tax=Burkholderia ubonensis TaxID=101571 RepID=UPI0007573C24|nr:DNA repair protein RadC [Burkholderia ubonensis]KVU61902.1 hypothetical protein WK71_26055 [Burkholderia ubonensis]
MPQSLSPLPECRAAADAVPRAPGQPKRGAARAKRPDLPRERLLERGPAALSDDELIVLLLGTGVPGHNVFDSARALLEHFGKSLRGLLDATPDDFRGRPGIGDARIARLSAVAELARRALAEKAGEHLLIDSPGAVEDYLRLVIGTRPYEVFMTLYLDARNRLVDNEESARGSLTRMAVYPREIVRRALSVNAAALVVAHNHPSGAVQPSAEDRRLTRVLRDALALFDVRLLDHVVVGATETFSFARAGLL